VHLSATEIPGGRDASGSGSDHHLATGSLGVLDQMRHLRASQPLDEPVLLATGQETPPSTKAPAGQRPKFNGFT